MEIYGFDISLHPTIPTPPQAHAGGPSNLLVSREGKLIFGCSF